MSTVERSFRPGHLDPSVAEVNTDIAKAVRLRSGEPSVYASFLCSIPPEESDEEFAAAVDQLS
jgi:hypothetical protein